MSHCIVEENSFVNTKEYNEMKVVLDSYPQVILIELTRNCKLACPMCARAKEIGNKYNPALNMDFLLFEKIASDIFSKVKIIDLHGNGETFDYPEINKVLNTVKKYKARPRIVSNFNFKDDPSLELAVKLNTLFAISMDSPNKEEYNKIREGGSFDLLIHNLSMLSFYSKKYGTCADTKIFMTLDLDNYCRLHEQIDYIKKLGIKHLHIWNRFLDESDQKNVIHDISTVENYILLAMEYATRNGIELRVLSWPRKFSKVKNRVERCHKPWAYMHINYDGSIGLCDYHETPMQLKELKLTRNNFHSCWNSDYHQKIRAEMNKKHNHRDINVDSFCLSTCIESKYIDFEDEVITIGSEYIFNNGNV